jgi:hypothetical protein
MNVIKNKSLLSSGITFYYAQNIVYNKRYCGVQVFNKKLKLEICLCGLGVWEDTRDFVFVNCLLLSMRLNGVG